MPRCVHCAKPIMKGEEICPSCGGEQPVSWMVTLVYVLAFLFVQGTIYRFVLPNATSLITYGAYFAATALVSVALLWAWKRLRRDHNKPLPGDHRE